MTARINLTPTAERFIAELAIALVAGEIEFWQLPDSLREFYVYASEAGRETASCRDHARLLWERDLYYFLVCNPGKTGADYYQHKTSELWRQEVYA